LEELDSPPRSRRNSKGGVDEKKNSPLISSPKRGRPPSSKSSLEESIQIQQEEIKKREDDRIKVILYSNQGRGRKSLTPEQPAMNIINENYISRPSVTAPVPHKSPISQKKSITSTTKSIRPTLEDELQANFRETYNNAERQKSLSKSLAQVRKREGNSFYKKEKYAEAIDKYSAAIELDDTDISFYSNRSACHIALQKYDDAVEDGQKCLQLDKTYLKGYYRTGLGLIGIGKYEAALKILQQGLELDPTNSELVKVVKDLKSHMLDTDDTTMAALPIGKNYRPDISPNPYTPNQKESRSTFTTDVRNEIIVQSGVNRFYSTLKENLNHLLFIPFSSFKNAFATIAIITSTYLFIMFKKQIIMACYWLAILSPFIITLYLYRRFKTESSEKVKATQQVIETIAELAKEQLSMVNTSNGFYPVEHLKWTMYTVVNEAIQEKVIPLTPMNTVMKYNKDRHYNKKLIDLLWKDIIKEVEKDPNIQPSTRDYEGKTLKCWRITGLRGKSPLPSFSSASSNSGMFSFFSKPFFEQKQKAGSPFESPKKWIKTN
jgi:tetratricopeptide (TPR) repeat protein